MNASPARRVAAFVRDLRNEGYHVGMRESVDSLQVLAHCDPPDAQVIRDGLRGLLCRSREEWRRFDELYDRYWLPTTAEGLEPPLSAAELVDPRLQHRRQLATTGLAHADTHQTTWSDPGFGGAGRQKTLTRTDYRFLTDKRDRRTIERLAERLALRLRNRLARRRRIAKRGRRIHLRRTLRNSLSVGGLPVHRRYVVRRRVPPRLVMIQDISHSMAHYNPLLTHFVRGLLRLFRGSEVFAFHTQLYRVTEWYRERDDSALQRHLQNANHFFLFPPLISSSFPTFNSHSSPRHVNGKTEVLVMSDGFDTDASDDLAAELDVLTGCAHNVVWLNPALGEGEPQSDEEQWTLGERVDLLLPANSFSSLASAVDVIARRI